MDDRRRSARARRPGDGARRARPSARGRGARRRLLPSRWHESRRGGRDARVLGAPCRRSAVAHRGAAARPQGGVVIEAKSHVSDLRWDRLLAGELAEADRREALAHADACPACTARRAEITAGLEAFVGAPPLVMRRSPRRWAVAALGVMAAMAAALVLRARPVDEAS